VERRFDDYSLDWVRAEVYEDGESHTSACWGSDSSTRLEGIFLREAADMISESTLVSLLPLFKDFTYSLEHAKYPFVLPGGYDPKQKKEDHPAIVFPKRYKDTGFTMKGGFLGAANNCCTFVEALVSKAWDLETDSLAWGLDRHKEMMGVPVDYPDEPISSQIDAIIACGMGEEIDPGLPPEGWTVVQGWYPAKKMEKKKVLDAQGHEILVNGKPKLAEKATPVLDAKGNAVFIWGGHTFFILAVHPGTERVLTLESNHAFKLDGPGFRKVGNLRDCVGNHPGKRWWEKPDLHTWTEIKQSYPKRRMAKLKVREVSWLD
jgi:hypothetical protein